MFEGLNYTICRFPTYTPGQQRGPSPPQNLGQRPPNAGDWFVDLWSRKLSFDLKLGVIPKSTVWLVVKYLENVWECWEYLLVQHESEHYSLKTGGGPQQYQMHPGMHQQPQQQQTVYTYHVPQVWHFVHCWSLLQQKCCICTFLRSIYFACTGFLQSSVTQHTNTQDHPDC